MTTTQTKDTASKSDAEGRHFYALRHPYGADTTYGDPENPKYGNLHAFPTKDARDEWVRQGPDFRSENGARSAVGSDHVEVQRYYRAKERGPRHQVGVEVRFHTEDLDEQKVRYF